MCEFVLEGSGVDRLDDTTRIDRRREPICQPIPGGPAEQKSSGRGDGQAGGAREAMAMPVAALDLQTRQQLIAQASRHLDLEHGLAKPLVKLAFAARQGVAISTMIEMVLQRAVLFRGQLLCLRPDEV